MIKRLERWSECRSIAFLSWGGEFASAPCADGWSEIKWPAWLHIWISEDPHAAESRGLESGQIPSGENVSRRGINTASGAKTRRRVTEHRRESFHPTGPNQVWWMDFVADQLAKGRRFSLLTIVDILHQGMLGNRFRVRLNGEDEMLALNRIKIPSWSSEVSLL